MGGSSSKSKKRTVKNPVEQNWQIVENGQAYNIVRSKTDGREAEQHFYILQNRYDPSGEAHIFDRRSQTTLPIVKVFDHQWQAKGTSLVPKNNFRVVTERLAHRLTSCPQLTFDESLYVLDRALEGYRFLYHSIGPFDINSNMIGFTQQGEVRVWVNENFGRNYPYHEKPTLQSTRFDETCKYNSDYTQLEEIQMVRNIINVVEDRCEQGQFPQEFRERIRQNIGFDEARRIAIAEYDNPQVVRLNKVDLWRNIVKSKISRLQGQTWDQTRQSYITSNPMKATTSYIIPANQQVQEIQPSQFQLNYAPNNLSGSKNAYSFNYQRVVQA